jgi:hypothetical protein
MRIAGSSVQRWLSDMIDQGMLVKVPDAQRAQRARGDYVNRSEAWDCYKAWAEASSEYKLSKHLFLTELYADFPAEKTPSFYCLFGLLPTDQWTRSVVAGNGWGAVRY